MAAATIRPRPMRHVITVFFILFSLIDSGGGETVIRSDDFS
jgi:hypothetical protein